MDKMTLRDVDIKNKRLLMRVDFNVPLDDKLEVSDDTRIKAALPSIEYAVKNGAKVILMSHLGRPDGKVVDKLRLDPVAKRLEKLLGKKVTKLNECIGDEVKNIINKMKSGDVVILENLRFHPEEEQNEPNFAKNLASLADIYVNDAFGTAHRAHASTEGVAKYLPAVSGFLLEKEIKYLGGLLSKPKKPFIAILGGAKVSDKIKVIDNLLRLADKILIGGGMAYTFLKARGENVGSSKLEVDKIDTAKQILENANAKHVQIVLPVDHIIADKIDKQAAVKTSEIIPDGWFAVDIGPKTIESFKSVLKSANTVIWNGPLGIFEIEPFGKGTEGIAKYLATLKAITVIGGGDTAAAVAKFGVENKMSHVSTGGGASLEFLEGRVLPGIAALKDKK